MGSLAEDRTPRTVQTVTRTRTRTLDSAPSAQDADSAAPLGCEGLKGPFTIICDTDLMGMALRGPATQCQLDLMPGQAG